MLQDWKKANVAPIYKKSERYCVANYQPVSLTCMSSKLMEHIVTKHLTTFLETNNILYDLQYGFLSKRSTETQLLTFTLGVINNLCDNGHSDVILMDFDKAFDKVPPQQISQETKEIWCKGSPQPVDWKFSIPMGTSSGVWGWKIVMGARHKWCATRIGCWTDPFSGLHQWPPLWPQVQCLIVCWWHCCLHDRVEC